MEITYKRTIGQSFMVLSEENIKLDYQVEMCRRNRLGQFLQFDTIVADGKMEFWYDITGMQSLEEYARQAKLGTGLLKMILEAVCDGIENAEKYLIAEQSVLLEPKLIFLLHGGEGVKLCCCPGVTVVQDGQLHSLLEYLLPLTDHSEERAVELVYQAYQVTLDAHYGRDKIRELLEEKRERQEEARHPTEPFIEEPMEPVEEDRTPRRTVEQVIGRVVGDKLRDLKNTVSYRLQKLSANKEEQLVFEPMEQRKEKRQQQTVFLGENKEEKNMKQLVYQGGEPERNIILKKEIYCIGSQEDADIRIENEMVSRLHARLNRVDGVYYIEDLNSRNGTWVNGQLLHYMEKQPLKDGDMICFAEESYQYKESGK